LIIEKFRLDGICGNYPRLTYRYNPNPRSKRARVKQEKKKRPIKLSLV